MADSRGTAFVRAVFRGESVDAFVPPLYYREPEATEASQAPHAPQASPAPPAPQAPQAPAPLGTVETVARRLMGDPCAVCLDPIREGDRMGTMRACLAAGAVHAFHARCIRPWLGMHASCPTCRTPASEE